MSKAKETSPIPTLPEGVTRLPDITIGGKTPDQLLGALETARGVMIDDYAIDMIRSRYFTTLPEPKSLSIVRTKLLHMGITSPSTWDQILDRADSLGWDKCPAEAAVYLRLAYIDQPLLPRIYGMELNDGFKIGMQPIADRPGRPPHVFTLWRSESGLWLGETWVGSNDQLFYPGSEVSFSLRTQASS